MLPAERRPPSRLDQRTCREERRCADIVPKSDRSDPGGSLQSSLQAKAKAIRASTRDRWITSSRALPCANAPRLSQAVTRRELSFTAQFAKPKTYSAIARARHRDSKLLSSSRIRACASMGSPLFSMATLTGATLTGATPTGAHVRLRLRPHRCGPLQQRFRDHGFAGVPAFRLSIRRQDQCPCAVDGRPALHSLASAAGALMGRSVATSTAKKTD